MFSRRRRSRTEKVLETVKHAPGAIVERVKDAGIVDRVKDAAIVERVKDAPGAILDRLRPPPPKAKRFRTLLAGASAGVAAMYFFDPQRGKGRRAQARDRAMGLARRTGRRLSRTGTRIASDAYGMKQRLAHPTPEHADYNDATLASKVESELFVGRDIPSDRVVINAENGVVILRGEVDRPEQISELEAAAAKIPGVRGVQTLLHLPNTPPPNKADAIRAS